MGYSSSQICTPRRSWEQLLDLGAEWVASLTPPYHHSKIAFIDLVDIDIAMILYMCKKHIHEVISSQIQFLPNDLFIPPRFGYLSHHLKRSIR